MKDPDEVHDTEPGGDCAETAHDSDTDPGGGPLTETTDALLEGLPTDPSEEPEEDFFRWLPTMWLDHRRRQELVQRRSSDGADFVAYAARARPVAASGPVPAEPTVQVQGASRVGSAVFGRDALRDRADAAERDAPTVLLPETRRAARSTRRVLAGALVAGAFTAIGLGSWIDSPRAKDPVSPLPAAALPVEQGRRVPTLEAPTSPTASAPPGPREEAQETPALAARPAAVPAAPSASPAAGPKESRRKVDAARPTSVPTNAPLGRRIATAAAASGLPAKEQYFEAP
jgi:hypothetical protein